VKIAYVVHDYHRAGGHSRYVAELASRFSKDHEVHVFANRIEQKDDNRIHFHRVPAWRANALSTVLTFAVMATFQVGRRFDIVHCQGFCGFGGNVFTAHICNRAWHLALKRWEGGTSWSESVFNAAASSLEWALYRFARRGAVVAVSSRVAGDIMRFYLCRLPMHVIYHGVDLQLFSSKNCHRWRAETRARYGLGQKEPVFLYVGDLRKGARRCILALSKLSEGRLMLVSRTPPGHYQRLTEQAGVVERVLFLGATNQVERIYAAADALLLPTPYDAFAMVISEAMACGLPVIVSREAGAAELIQHKMNGLLLDDMTNVAELARYMQSLLQDQQWAAKLGSAARKSIEAMSWEAVAARTLRVYEEVSGKRSKNEMSYIGAGQGILVSNRAGQARAEGTS
jgi:UDP-glucose:(heptosyl)LPS alpha-1,3-glucosyltransferase